MAVINNHVEIARPPEEVFDYCVDLCNELEWNPDAQSMDKVTEGPIGVGTRIRAKWRQSGVVEVEYTRFDRPHAWSTVARGPLEVLFDGRVSPSGDGSRLDVRFEARPHGAVKLVFPLLLIALKRAEKRNMGRIKQALESRR